MQEFAEECAQLSQWKTELSSAYPEKAIPWDKKQINPAYSEVEHLLYDLCLNGFGFIVGLKHPFYMHLLARLVEEVYQGEVERNKGYIIVGNRPSSSSPSSRGRRRPSSTSMMPTA